MIRPRGTAIRRMSSIALVAIAVSTGRGAFGFDDLRTLVRFTGTNGSQPGSGVVLDSAGNVYGTTYYGGTTGGGLVYKLTPGGSLSVVHEFDRVGGGSDPISRLTIDSRGNLYGTTNSGGLGLAGTVFKIAADGTFSTLHEFSTDDGAYPEYGLTLDSQGNLYGTTPLGGTGAGTLFEITAGGTFSVLYNFSEPDGALPSSGVVIDSQGNLYGTTYNDSGSDDGGRAYKYAPGGGPPTTVTTFSTAVGGPVGDLAMDASGNLYGTTQTGGDVAISGQAVSGTVYRLSTSGTLTILHQFRGYTIANSIAYLFFGDRPTGSVTLDARGNVYGTTYAFAGFTAVPGLLYKITPAGDLTTLAVLADGTHPNDGLAIDPLGNIYGTQQFGLDVEDVQGVVFKLSPRP